MHARGDRALGQQVGVLAAAQRKVSDLRVVIQQLLLTDLGLRVFGLAHEVHAQVEEFLVLAVFQHVLDRGDQALGLQIARAQAVSTGVQARHVLGLVAGVLGVLVGIHAVLQALGQRGAHLAHQRQVFGQRLVGALEHHHALLALQRLADQVAGEGSVHGQVEHANLEFAAAAQVIGDCVRLHHHRTLADDHVVGIVHRVLGDAVVAASGQFVVLVHHLVGDAGDVLEEVRALRGHRLHVGVLVLHGAGLQRVVHAPHLGHAAALVAVDHLLRGGRAVDDVIGATAEFLDQLALGHHQRLDQVGGQKAVLSDRRRGQRQLGDLATDQVQVGCLLGVGTEDLEEAGVVDAMVIIVAAMHVQRGLGDRAGADVQHIRQALADRRVQRLVHEGDALRRRKVGGAQAAHRHAGGDRGCGVFGFGLDEDQRLARDIHMTLGGFLRPVLTHLRGRGDRVGAGGIRGLALAHDHGAVAVHRHADTRVLEGFRLFLSEHDVALLGSVLISNPTPGVGPRPVF